MNLYRSFGNLMEAWVAEGSLYSDSESLGNNDGDSPAPSSSDMETNLRSDSVDSGVETASCDTSFPATSCSAEIDGFIPEVECEGLTSASTSQSPVLSSPVASSSSTSSPRLCPSKPLESSIALHPKVEQALQRTDSRHQKDKPGPLTVEEVLRRRPQASFLHKRPTSVLVRGRRSESFGPRKTNPPISIGHISEIWTRPRSVSCDKQRLEELGEEERTGLSPGLIYLEQVCQMLEEIARQQMHNTVLGREMEALRENQGKQASDTCQSGSEAPQEALSSYQSLENTENAEHSSSEPQQKTDKPCRHFRQRSASDTTFTALHLRQMNSDCRGQHLSTGNLLEKTEKDHEKEESKTEESSKTNKNWRLKIGSLKREESSLRGSKGKPTQSSEKNSARRQLSQLFRRRKIVTV